MKTYMYMHKMRCQIHIKTRSNAKVDVVLLVLGHQISHILRGRGNDCQMHKSRAVCHVLYYPLVHESWHVWYSQDNYQCAHNPIGGEH